DEGEVRFEIAMRPAKATVVTVLSPDGRPAVNADVGLVSRGARLELKPGGFSRVNLQSGGSLVSRDGKGQFGLPSGESITRVIAATAECYAEANVTGLEADPTIHLQPWGRLEGIYLSGGRGVAGRELLFQFGNGDFNTVSSEFGAYKVMTDGE